MQTAAYRWSAEFLERTASFSVLKYLPSVQVCWFPAKRRSNRAVYPLLSVMLRFSCSMHHGCSEPLRVVAPRMFVPLAPADFTRPVRATKRDLSEGILSVGDSQSAHETVRFHLAGTWKSLRPLHSRSAIIFESCRFFTAFLKPCGELKSGFAVPMVPAGF